MGRRNGCSSIGAAIRSFFIPGWGQVATNRPVLGRVFLFLTGLVGVAALTVFLFVPRIEIASWIANPDILLLIVLLNLGFAVLRLSSTEMAWRDSGGRGWVVAVALAVLIAIPHAAIAWVGLETRTSLMTVFAEEVAEAATTSTTSTSTTTTTTTLPLELSPITTLPGQLGDDEIEADKAPPWRPFGQDRLNILILGGDAGPGRGGVRTDTIMVASIDPITGDAALLGLPRNYGGLHFTDGEAIPVRRLNHVFGYGERHADRFGETNPGAEATKNAVENITGLEIDHHVMVDLTGFADVIDVFGGVTLDIPVAVDGPLYDTVTGTYEMVEIRPGTRKLDGDHALAYARARIGSSDYVRMGRQRCILTALARQTNPLSILANFSSVLDVFESNITTDIPIDTLPDMVQLMLRVSADQIRVTGFDATWRAGFTADAHPIPDVPRIREAVRQMIEEPSQATAIDITTAEEACG